MGRPNNAIAHRHESQIRVGGKLPTTLCAYNTDCIFLSNDILHESSAFVKQYPKDF